MSNDLCVTDEITLIRAELLLRRSASRKTLERIEKLLGRFPESPELWVLRGDAVLALGRSAGEAIECYEHALALDPDHSEAAERIRSVTPSSKMAEDI